MTININVNVICVDLIGGFIGLVPHQVPFLMKYKFRFVKDIEFDEF